MKKYFFILSACLSSIVFCDCPEILNHDVRVLDSEETKNLCEYKNNTVLAVNVASRCGFTYQYEGLQKLYLKYKSEGLVVLGFPSRDFLFQEFKDESKVKEFCTTKYGVSFPMFATSAVKGRKANSFFKSLASITGEEPGWNFHKYVITKKGEVKSFATKIEPNSDLLVSHIKSNLN
tara:strand:- start:269 stop:799 length:531 start_codon:yes stop_codon:yes gene_type:complete